MDSSSSPFAAAAQPDYYAVLGLDADRRRDTTLEDVRRAYKKLARQHHPDSLARQPAAAHHCGHGCMHDGGCQHHYSIGSDDDRDFKLVVEAYQVLGDATSRRVYDAYGHSGLYLLRSIPNATFKTVEFVLSVRKYQVLSVVVGLDLVFAYASLFRLVRKLSSAGPRHGNSPSYSWGIAAPLWLLFAIVLGFLEFMAYKMVALDLAAPATADSDDLEKKSSAAAESDGLEEKRSAAAPGSSSSRHARIAQFVGLSVMFVALLAPWMLRLWCWARVADVGYSPAALGLYVLITLLHVAISISQRQKTPPAADGLARLYQFAVIAKSPLLWCLSLWCLAARSTAAFWLWYADFATGLPLDLLLGSLLPPIKALPRQWWGFGLNILVLLPVFIPLQAKIVGRREYSWHWCLVPLHILLAAGAALALFVVPVFLGRLVDFVFRSDGLADRAAPPQGLSLFSFVRQHRHQPRINSS